MRDLVEEVSNMGKIVDRRELMGKDAVLREWKPWKWGVGLERAVFLDGGFKSLHSCEGGRSYI